MLILCCPWDEIVPQSEERIDYLQKILMKNFTNCIIRQLMFVAIMFQGGCSESPNKDNCSTHEAREKEMSQIELNLRVHIMKDIIIPHPSGIDLDCWVSTDAV